MLRQLLLRFALLSVFLCAALHAQDVPDLKGYVIQSGTPQAFDVDGVHITCSAATRLRAADGPARTGSACPQRAYGEHLAIFGKWDKQSNSIAATEIDAMDSLSDSVDGFALVDRVLTPTLLRVDGFALQTTPKTEVEWKLPLLETSEPAVSQWVEYHGKLNSGGVVVASSLTFHASEVTAKEEKLRNKHEFDPEAVTDDDEQGVVSKFFRGTDYKRIPAVHDASQQERLDRIGHRLIPAYQNELPATDRNKLNFRFQLVKSKWTVAAALPSGIVLVPLKVLQPLNDDELAAVLAQGMAVALEKQAFRYIPKAHAMTATNIVGSAAGLFVPGLSLATSLGTGVADSRMQRQLEEQCGRMSLVLLHDAGFDIRQAPIAWWRLSTKQAEFLKKPTPRRSAYLFKVIATVWNPSSPLFAPPGPSAPLAPAAPAVISSESR